MTATELEQLIDSLLDGEISEADFLRLEAELQLCAGARACFYEKLRLDTLLQMESGETASGPARLARVIPWRRIAFALAASIALLFSALSGWLVGKRPAQASGPGRLAENEPAASGFAVVAETAGAVWRSRPLNRGDLVPPGELQLASGMVKLELFSGVAVVVEGEADIELRSPMEMQVTRGKVRALVPEPAQGFRIVTASGELVDLGTEFVIDVAQDHADLHVLQGEVEWHPVAADSRSLKQGQAIRWADGGGSEPLELESQSMADIDLSIAALRSRRRDAWLAHIEQRRDDPRLIAYFPMHQVGDWARTLSDASAGSHDAAIVRARRVADRWEHPLAALDFSPTGSRARLVLPDTYRSLTFICWAKIDSLDRWYNSLFLTDGHELNEPHWQIMDDGRLFFSVKKREWKSPAEPDKHIFYSPPFWNRAMSGRWIMLATVYDADARAVTHFINGAAISSERVPDGYLVEDVQIGAASIGNWSEPKNQADPKFAVRNLNGAIDEFAIYAAALGAEEIADLYQVGKP